MPRAQLDLTQASFRNTGPCHARMLWLRARERRRSGRSAAVPPRPRPDREASGPSPTSCGRRPHRPHARPVRGPHLPSLDDGIAYAEQIGFAETSSSAASGLRTGSPPRWSTPASRSASSRRSSSRRPGRGTRRPAVLLVRSAPRVRRPGRRACPCRCTAWTPTRSSPARATSTPPASSSRRPRTGRALLYPGDQHYFVDPTLPSYDAEAATLLTQRVLEFLRTR